MAKKRSQTPNAMVVLAESMYTVLTPDSSITSLPSDTLIVWAVRRFDTKTVDPVGAVRAVLRYESGLPLPDGTEVDRIMGPLRRAR